MPLRVGRLFSKFFLAFFLAQMLTVIGVGGLIWWAGPEPHLPEPGELPLEWPTDRPDPALAGEPGRPVADAPAPGAAIDGRGGKAAPPGVTPLAGAPSAIPGANPGAIAADEFQARALRARNWQARVHRPWWERRRGHGFPYLPVGVGLLASALFAYLLARSFAEPILALSRAFSEVGRGNLKLRLGPALSRHPDELESLRTEFDTTVARLEVLVEGQRRLLHDVSHEVRSPVARLQLALDLIGQQPSRAPELHGRMERECRRIDHLMEELLTLSRLEARAFGPLEQQVDLGEILHAITEDAGFEGSTRGIRVTLRCVDPLLVTGHAELLHRAVENIVRNALIHSPDDGLVSIQVAQRGDGKLHRIVIEDQGAGAPAQDLERMFQPFKRLSSDTNGDGHGLGLAITREAMAIHGGVAYAENRAEGGLRVVLDFLPEPAA